MSFQNCEQEKEKMGLTLNNHILTSSLVALAPATDLVSKTIAFIVEQLAVLADETHSISMPWSQKISNKLMKQKRLLTATYIFHP